MLPTHRGTDESTENLSNSIRFVTTFSSTGCAGNTHAVAINPQPRNGLEWQAHSEAVAPAILVIVHKPPQDAVAKARFFHYGRSVAWCGSGILAAAKALQLAGLNVDTIATNSARYKLLYHHGQLGFATQADFVWRPVRNKALWRRLFGQALIGAIESPHRNGYTLVELCDEHAVKTWRPRLRQLQRYSQRALILTAQAQGQGDYVMRYFAPQYGNSEDGATGSANALLIPYWAKRLNRSWLRGRQLSATGGQFYGRSLGRGRAAIFGNTQALK